MARVVALAILLIAALVPPAQAYVCYGPISIVCDVVPPPPTAFVAQTMSDGVHMSWQEPLFVDGTVERYVVHRIHVQSRDHEHFDAGLALSYVDVPTVPGLYVYYVTAEYQGSGSVPSNPFLAYWPPWPHCHPASVIVNNDPFVLYSNCLTPLPI